MIRTFFRHVLESFKGLTRNFLMTLASVSVVAFTLALVGFVLMIILNVREFASQAENDVRVSIFMEVGTNKKEQSSLKKELEKITHVKKIDFSSKDVQLKELKDKYGDSWDLFQGDSNPLYDTFIVSTDNPKYMKQVAEKAKKLKNVSHAEYGGMKAEWMIHAVEIIQVGIIIVAGVLLVIAIFLISNTVRMTILSRQTDIQIMRLVGAENGFIRWPFFLEGAWIGVIGSIGPALSIYLGYKLAYNCNAAFAQIHFSMLDPATLLWQVNGLIILVGVLIGSFGSILAMRRFLKT